MSTCKCKNNQTDNLKELDEILDLFHCKIPKFDSE